MIQLKKYQKYFIDNEFYLIIEGKILLKEILSNGKIIVNEYTFSQGDIIGNYFNILILSEKIKFDIGITIEAIENTILKKVSITRKELEKNILFKHLVFSILKKMQGNLNFQVYSKKGYLLAFFKSLADEKGVISKKNIRYEGFNISKSQFYNLFSSLKSEGYFKDKEDNLILNLDKISDFLNKELEA